MDDGDDRAAEQQQTRREAGEHLAQLLAALAAQGWLAGQYHQWGDNQGRVAFQFGSNTGDVQISIAVTIPWVGYEVRLTAPDTQYLALRFPDAAAAVQQMMAWRATAASGSVAQRKQ